MPVGIGSCSAIDLRWNRNYGGNYSVYCNDKKCRVSVHLFHDPIVCFERRHAFQLMLRN